MPIYSIPTDFPSLAVAVASPLVVNGDTLQLEVGYNETLLTTLTINKDLYITGGGIAPPYSTIRTAGGAGDPAIMITLNSPNFTTFVDLNFEHLKTTNTGTERIFNSTGLRKLTLDGCNLNHMEFGVVGVYEDLTITNCVFRIDGITPLNQNIHITLTGIKGDFLFDRITFDGLAGTTQTRFIALSANASFPMGNGGDCSVIVKNCSWDGTGNLATGVYFSRFDFMGTGLINLDCRNNKWEIPNTGALGCYRFNSTGGETNILNNFRNIRFSGNRHNTAGIGMLSAGGTGIQRPLGLIQGDWTICSNQIKSSISSGAYSIYHFCCPPEKKIFGVQNAVFVNPYPTSNPYQTYINCRPNPPRFILPKPGKYMINQHKYNRRLL